MILKRIYLMNKWKQKADAAYDALIGKRDDVYPCREDVPAELWGEPIQKKSVSVKEAE